MEVISLLVVGIVAGIFAAFLLGNPGEVLSDIVFSVFGSFLSSWVMNALRISFYTPGSFNAFLCELVVATTGAILFIAAWRYIHAKSLGS